MTGPAVIDDWRERIARAAKAGSALRIRGAGTKDFYGENLAGEVLDTRAWHGIVAYEPTELVLTARCGTPLSHLTAALAAHGQYLACEPPGFGGDPTLGGIVAAGLSGPRRPYAGGVRDFVLGARLLTARGELLRFGGEVMKNVAGFDVARLLCGSLGILGLITEVSLKVLPRPREERTLRLELSAAEALERFNRWAGKPLPLSGAAWCDGTAWVRLSGAAPTVRAAAERIGGECVAPPAATAFWEALREMTLPALRSPVLWRVSLPPAAPALPLPGTPVIDWGGAVRWYAALEAAVDVRGIAAAHRGNATCWRGPAPAGRFPPLPAAVASLNQRLKERFDPAGIFNPVRLLPGI